MPSSTYAKELVVKFRQDVDGLPQTDNLENYLVKENVCDWSQVTTVAKDASLHPFVRKLESCDKLRSRAEQLKLSKRDRTTIDLSKYFILQNLGDADTSALRAKIESWPAVEKVEIVPKVGYPQAQTYLLPASDGVGALPVRPINGGSGEMIRVADIEGAWTLNHPAFTNLRAFRSGNVPWVIDPDVAEHGTNVLGVLCGSDQPNQFTGIAPNLERVFVVSHGGSAGGVVRAILDAGEELLQAPRHTGIILLEVEFSKPGVLPYPCELDDYVFEAISEVTEAGITVVEAAGNGDRDLVAYPAFDKDHRDFRDSGAIIVAAGIGSQQSGWRRWPGSNYGRRVDCFAAGQNVKTATSQGMNYGTLFGGTSSAAAIIAGVAAVTQSMALHIRGAALQPEDLRNLLRNSKFGTASASNTEAEGGQWIGNMPDLALIAQRLTAEPT